MALSGKRVVVTGGSGFLGLRVDAEFRARGAEVLVARKRDYDLVQREACRRLLADTRPDIVVHLAARVGGIGANRENPGLFFFENLMMGVQLVEECRLAGVPKVVTIGTICSYPKHTPVPFKEDALWDGYPEETNAPYGLAKKMLLVQGQAYRQQYGMNVIHLLPVNLYGPGDNFDPATSHVIPALIETFRRSGANRPFRRGCLGHRQRVPRVPLRRRRRPGNPDGDRAYDGVDPVNLGAGFEITIRDLTLLIARLTGFSGEIRWDTSKPDGQPRRSLDTTRAERLFGFRAEVPFEDGLRRTIAWYRERPREALWAAGRSGPTTASPGRDR